LEFLKIWRPARIKDRAQPMARPSTGKRSVPV